MIDVINIGQTDFTRDELNQGVWGWGASSEEIIERIEDLEKEGYSVEFKTSLLRKIFCLCTYKIVATKELSESIPLYVQLLAKTIPLCKWNDSKNLSRGEIKKFNFIESQKGKHKFNDQVVGNEGDYDMIWRHVADDYFKCIGKSIERTC